MGLPVLIYGKSGSGKSRSLKFFDENEVVLFNTDYGITSTDLW
nr:MAG TPA_asm: recA bacterial DNA recombination protein [Caudoviricetes sp.]